MTPLQVGLIHAGIRSAQICAVIGFAVGVSESLWGLLLAPVIGVMLWAWQVLYENVP